MLKLIIKIIIPCLLAANSVWADDFSKMFDQDQTNYPAPKEQESYYATLAPMEGESSGYFGMDLGAAITSLKPRVQIDTDIREESRKIPNYQIGLYGGYGRNFQHLYLGGELSAAYNFIGRDMALHVSSQDTAISLKQPVTFALDIIPGYLVRARDLLFYARLGMASSWFNLKFASSSGATDKINKFAIGLRAGLGIEYFMLESLSIRGEYLYSKYKKLSNSFSSSGKQYDYSLDNNSSHQIKIGLSLHF